MVAQIKYLIFKGISKKEQILFKSFLNLAKNDLDYQVVVLKSTSTSPEAPDIVVADTSYQFEESEAALASLPIISVGDEVNDQRQSYVSRPIQWSEFKAALTSLEVNTLDPAEHDAERVLPSNVEFDIGEMDAEDQPKEIATDAGFKDEGDYDYELDNLSIDYHSFTNSDYMKVVEDVKQFNEGEAPEVGEAVILVTDDESGSSNSVLVIETNSLDAWEFSVSEVTVDANKSASNEDEDTPSTFNSKASQDVVLERRAGFDIAPSEIYWHEDNEIIADHETVLFIKTERDMVYSTMEPAKWPRALQNKSLSRLPLDRDWKPSKGLNAYPLSRLLWVDTLINQNSVLHDDLPEDGAYILTRWPHFDLLELDNNLLKLCTMLFVRPETVNSLSSKSGYGRSTVRGLMNACYKEGMLKPAEDVDVESFADAINDEGVFGKIKDVFR